MHFFNYRSIYTKRMKYSKGQKFRKWYQYQNLSTVLHSEKNKKNQSKSIKITKWELINVYHIKVDKIAKLQKTVFLLTICLDHGGRPSFNSSGHSSNYDEGDMQSNSRPPSDMPPSLDELENFMTSMRY